MLTELRLGRVIPLQRSRRAVRGRGTGPARRERGVVLFVCLILLLVLTVMGVSLARQQTVEERLAQNEFNHELALQAAQAMLKAAYDDVGGQLAGGGAMYTSGTPGLATLGMEFGAAPYTALDRAADWSNPGVNTIPYGTYGAPLANVPAAAAPQFVVEDMPPATPKWCQAGNAGNYSTQNVVIRRITAHAAGADGTASATVQEIRYGNC